MIEFVEPLLDKNKVIDLFKNLPEMVSSEDLIEKIIMLSKIEEALLQAKNGRVYSHESVMKEARQWLKK